jgi:hypothetical protein
VAREECFVPFKRMRTSALMRILVPQGWRDEDHVFGKLSLVHDMTAFPSHGEINFKPHFQYAKNRVKRQKNTGDVILNASRLFLSYCYFVCYFFKLPLSLNFFLYSLSMLLATL